MSYEVFLALRYLRSRRKQRFARATILIAVLGIAVGVASLIVALALADGFRDEMRDKILSGTAHITVMRADGQPLQDVSGLSNQVRQVPGVAGSSGTTYDGAVAIGPKGSAYAVLRGLDPDAQRNGNFSNTLVRGSFAPLFTPQNDERVLPSVVLGIELAKRLGVQVGENADVIVARPEFSSSSANRRRVRVAGIFRSGLFEYDSTWIYLSLDTVAAFTGDAHAASILSVQVADIYDVKQVAAKIKEKIGNDFQVIDWQEANKPLFAALALERRIGIVIIALVVLIAALNITTTLILLVRERRRDIAILNALGSTPKSIMSIFMLEGAIVGAVGAIVGVLVAVVSILIVNRYHLISLPADVYSISVVPLRFDGTNLFFAALLAFALTVLATIYPARAAARVHAAALLRNS